MRIRQRWTRVALVIGTTVALAACESENPLDTNLITIGSLPDLFTFSVNGLDNVSGAERYYWAVTGGEAAVEVTSSISSGTAIIQIRDGAGNIVYQEDAADAVADTTTAAVQGFWQINVVLTKVTGGFDFSVQRVDSLSGP
jgi:hypothetical protein